MSALTALRQRLLGQSRFDPRSYFTVPLFDLGEISPQFTGILAPEPERGIEKIGITEQFLENAATYHERYAHPEHFMGMFNNGLRAAGFEPQPNLRILDIGAGSGANSVVPCARLFPNSEIIATDLSPQLLSILSSYLRTADLPVKVACVCTDAMNDFTQPKRFDLVIGAAILHHLMDPSKAIRSASRALRPGGIAIFAEPYEAGHLVLAAAYRQILSLKDRMGGLNPAPEKVLRDMIQDWMVRAGRDKSAPHFPYMDDKWLFTRAYMREVAQAAGFREVLFISNAATGKQFAAQTETLLRLHSGLVPSALPDWAWAIINTLDETFTDELKDEMALEAVTVFRS
jgi:2-polyprenyl-3-methyl-5-hydroxy-6-metoxy-1,4-benzoquinol methylase